MDNKIGRISGAALILLIMASASSCKKNDDNRGREEARRLFDGMVNLTKAYTDSIKAAKDTTQLNELIGRFEERIDKMNFDVAPDTDYSLTEGENDTITMMMDKFSAERMAKLKALSEQKVEPADSVAE